MADKIRAEKVPLRTYRGRLLASMSKEQLIEAFLDNDRQLREKIADLQDAIDVLTGADDPIQ